MQLIDEIKKKLKEEGLSVLKLSNETGISAYKIYKWLDKKGSPKAEDSKILEKWLRSDLEQIQNGTMANNNSHAPPVDTRDKTIQVLESQVSLLMDERDRLRKECEVNSKLLRQYAQVNAARIKTIVECQKLLRSKAEKVSLQQASDEVDKLYQETLVELLQGEAGR